MHDECLDKFNQTCCSGSLKKIILNPEEILYNTKKSTKLSSSSDDLKTFKKIEMFTFKNVDLQFISTLDKCPIVVLINKNSGG